MTSLLQPPKRTSARRSFPSAICDSDHGSDQNLSPSSWPESNLSPEIPDTPLIPHSGAAPQSPWAIPTLTRGAFRQPHMGEHQRRERDTDIRGGVRDTNPRLRPDIRSFWGKDRRRSGGGGLARLTGVKGMAHGKPSTGARRKGGGMPPQGPTALSLLAVSIAQRRPRREGATPNGPPGASAARRLRRNSSAGCA